MPVKCLSTKFDCTDAFPCRRIFGDKPFWGNMCFAMQATSAFKSNYMQPNFVLISDLNAKRFHACYCYDRSWPFVPGFVPCRLVLGLRAGARWLLSSAGFRIRWIFCLRPRLLRNIWRGCELGDGLLGSPEVEISALRRHLLRKAKNLWFHQERSRRCNNVGEGRCPSQKTIMQTYRSMPKDQQTTSWTRTFWHLVPWPFGLCKLRVRCCVMRPPAVKAHRNLPDPTQILSPVIGTLAGSKLVSCSPEVSTGHLAIQFCYWLSALACFNPPGPGIPHPSSPWGRRRNSWRDIGNPAATVPIARQKVARKCEHALGACGCTDVSMQDCKCTWKNAGSER